MNTLVEICNAIQGLGRLNTQQVEVLCRQVRDQGGYGNYDFVNRNLRRERVKAGREKRVRVSAKQKMQMFDRQLGLCACGCGENLLVPIHKNHADHFNPDDVEDFNNKKNMRLLLPQHNLKKSSKSPSQIAKEDGRTIAQQIQDSHFPEHEDERIDP